VALVNVRHSVSVRTVSCFDSLGSSPVVCLGECVRMFACSNDVLARWVGFFQLVLIAVRAGKLLWTRELPTEGEILVGSGESFYFLIPSMTMTAMSVETGEDLWSAPLPERVLISAVIGGHDNFIGLHNLNARSGVLESYG
jgi:hypothetical protein